MMVIAFSQPGSIRRIGVQVVREHDSGIISCCVTRCGCHREDACWSCRVRWEIAAGNSTQGRAGHVAEFRGNCEASANKKARITAGLHWLGDQDSNLG